eukprot:TRINITY_DN15635_c0_g1_i1.p1 TRINITY_DN15635_c0_g1~~TRINITY_DN15635_c0_g1_i1.p1  ORF type:complete len:536 (-),score=42.72 TRINITY_DN15635_c0_g1_i1:53-1660(-)
MDTIFAAIGMLPVLVHGLLLLRQHAQTIRWGCAFAKRFLSLQISLVSWTHCCAELCQAEAHSKLFERKVLQRKVDGMSNAFATAAHMCSFVLCSFVLEVMVERDVLATPPQMVSVFVASCTSICASYMLALTSISIEICFAILMIAASIFVWSSSFDTFFLSCAAMFIVQVILSVPSVNLRSVLVWNLVVLGASVAHVVQHQVRRSIVVLLASFTALIIVSAVGFKRWTFSSARQEIDINGLNIEKSASSALLDLACDVVVQLDGKLNIDSDSRAFKALLMKTSGATAKGVPFTNYISDKQERQDFEVKLLAAQTASEGKVGTFRTTLSDSLRNRFPADLFFVKFEVDVDFSRYLVGIRECRESDVVETPPLPPSERDESDAIETPSVSSNQHKMAKPSGQKGTPSTSERAEFRTASAPPQASISHHLVLPQMGVTSKNAQYSSMLECFSSWNLSVDRTTCCSLHAYVMAAKMVLKDLRDEPCDASFPSFASDRMQCQSCGIIEADGEDRMCGTCGSTSMKSYELNREASRTVRL